MTAAKKEQQNVGLDYSQHLIESGLLTSQQLDVIKQEQKEKPKSLRSILLEGAFISEKDYLQWACQESGHQTSSKNEQTSHSLEYTDKTHTDNFTETQRQIITAQKKMFYDLKSAPINEKGTHGTLTVLVIDPLDIDVIQSLEKMFPNETLIFKGALERDF